MQRRREPMTATRDRCGASALLAALAAATIVAGCAAVAPTPDEAELRNMDADNIVPKSSPAQLVAAFEYFCLDTAPAALPVALRRADYVEVPRWGAARMRSFVVDDRRPVVMIAADGRACAVGATARTGQTERLRAMVARRFPDALPVDPARIGASTDEAWAISGDMVGILFVQRPFDPARPSQLILGIQRPA